MSLPRVQTWLAQRAAAYLAAELNTKVEIDYLHFKPFRKLSLEGVYIEDLKGDTLVYVKELEVEIKSFVVSKSRIKFRSLVLNEANINIKKYKGEESNNLKFLIDYFAGPPRTDTSIARPFILRSDDLKIQNSKFSYLNFNKPHATYGVDWDYVSVSNLNLDAKLFRLEDDSISTELRSLSLKESAGFVLDKLSSVVSFSSSGMQFKDLQIQTPYSKINTQLEFAYSGWGMLNQFISEVNIRSNFERSEVSLLDISYFANDLEGLDQDLIIEGQVRGRVDQLKGKNIKFSYGLRTQFQGDISMSGLPKWNNTFIDLIIDDFKTTPSDLATIPLPPFTSGNKIKLPAELFNAGLIKFKGKFTGFPEDFVAYGDLRSNFGTLSSDINLKIDSETRLTEYSGHLNAIDFDAGALTGSSKVLGKVSFNSELKGHGLKIDNVKAFFKGNVSSIELNGYNYKNIVVDAEVASKMFKGSLSVKEQNIDLDFNGTIDFREEDPIFNFTADLKDASLAKLNLLKREGDPKLNSVFEFKFSGKKIDDLVGSMDIRDLTYIENDKKYEIKNFQFTSESGPEGKTLTLVSDLADISLKGSFNLEELPASLQKLLNDYVPAYIAPYRKKYAEQDLSIYVLIHDFGPIHELFLPTLNLTSGTKLESKINTINKDVRVNYVSEKMDVGGIIFNNINLDIVPEGSQLFLTTDAKNVILNDSITFEKFGFNAHTQSGSINSSLILTSKDSLFTSIHLNGIVGFPGEGAINIRTKPSVLKINKIDWKISENNEVYIDSSRIEFKDLKFFTGTQSLSIDGIVSRNPQHILKLNFEKFELATLQSLFSQVDIELGGNTNGSAELSGLYSEFKANAILDISNFSFNGDTLGNMKLQSNYDYKKNAVGINCVIAKGVIPNVDIQGTYFVGKNRNKNFDLDIKVQRIYLQVLEPYLKGIFSDMHGILTADIRLDGTNRDPVITGNAKVQKANFKVDYLNAYYSFTQDVIFTDKYIGFTDLTLNDSEGNNAKVLGRIYHDHFRNWRMDLTISPENMMLMNSNSSQNSLYYGKAYATGTIQITGSFQRVVMRMNLRTEKGTSINIPLTNPEEISASDFITFINRDSTAKPFNSEAQSITGVQIFLDLEATPDAEIQLIFDDKLGDVIRGRGSGNLKMEISTAGDFTMYGTYIIDSGDYLFTLQNVINKRFKIESGGSISWNGQVYDAEIDINAVYKTRASLYDLLQDTTSNYKKRVPVNVELNLSEKLMNPTISFDIEVPDASPEVESLVDRYINTEQEMNKQVFALLIMNRFSTPAALSNNFITSNAGVSNNASELLSNQLSNWASQISRNLEIGLNYRPGDALSKEELEIGVSKQFFNDRVNVDGNVGVINDPNASNVVGDVNVEVKISKDGRFRIKTYNKSNQNTFLLNSAPYTQGVGMFYRVEFDTVKELVNKFRKRMSTQKDTVRNIPGVPDASPNNLNN